MVKQSVKHVSFDLDGTLIDSFPAMEIAWKAVMIEFDIATPFSKYRKLVGLPFHEIMRQLELEDHLPMIQEVYIENSLQALSAVSIIDGTHELFSNLKDMNISTSIITSKPRKSAEIQLSRIGIQTKLLICGDDFSKGKPNSAAGDHLLQRLNLLPQDIVYVGDMIFDMQFAHNCNFNFLYFENNGRNKLPSNLLNKVNKVNNLREILQFLPE